jgi:NAD+ synthase (glutamine-hydrolysing)
MSPTTLRVAVAQLNVRVGDIAANTAAIVDGLAQARAAGADIAVFPELAVCGYPPEDLLLRPSFVAANEAAVAAIARHTAGLTAIVGFADRAGGDLFNAAAVLHDGRLVDVYHKAYLPNYGVFDEERYFKGGDRAPVYRRGDARFGVSICEDIWYPIGPPELQARSGAALLVNISASPFVQDKHRMRERMLRTRAADNTAFLVYCNLVGGQDELLFDGNSLVVGPTGDILARGASFAPDMFVVDLNLEEVFRERLLDPRNRKVRFGALRGAGGRGAWRGGGGADVPAEIVLDEVHKVQVDNAAERDATPPSPRLSSTPPTPSTPPPPSVPLRTPADPGPPPLVDLAEVWAALKLGTRDYVHKNGFQRVVLGLSGGIDSALVATLAADALGPAAVVCVGMPTRYSAPESLGDARDLCERQGIEFLTIGIDDAFQSYLDMLAPTFAGRAPDTTEENIQSRIRGNVLMALSNKFGWMVLATGNKSETSVGYSTLYGDTAGGFAPIKDVLKMLVYDLARWRNALGPAPVIPERSIQRPPTAELRANQTDQDTLPPYAVLDPILVAYVEDELSVDEIVALLGADRTVVDQIARWVDRAEYKRRQAPPGIKITARAFGRDRRMPITKRVTGVDSAG